MSDTQAIFQLCNDANGRCSTLGEQINLPPSDSNPSRWIFLMTPAQFFVSQQLTPGLINGVINGAIAWSMHRQTPVIGLWEEGGYATDLIATGFLLPAITWFIVKPLLARQVGQGKALHLGDLPTPKLLPYMPTGTGSGALAIGLMGMLLVGGACVLLLQLLGSPDILGADYALFKGLFALLLTIVLQPTMVFAAVNDAQTKAQGQA